MSGLVLKLAPNERVLINGAVIENGNRRGRLNIVTPNANILRLRDAIHPNETDSPVRRLCYIAQLVLSGDKTMTEVRQDILKGIDELRTALFDAESLKTLAEAHLAVNEDQAYYVLKSLRALLPREAQLLSAARA